MNSVSSAAGPIDADEIVADLIEELAARLQAGEPIELDECIRQHPAYAERLRELLPAVRVLARAGQANGPTDPSAQSLGDFRLLRELGRGGMGVVYEAEQVSLGRRVAVKVLPFAGVLDPRQLGRFRNEARAAALLQHPNIVPVHAVGCDRGIHYYAMQLIAGQTLAISVAKLRRQAEQRPNGAVPAHHTPPYFQAVARLGVQAARALEYAHQQGVIHRDVKPANLLIDGQGKVWVADFGLACVRGGAGLTATGDLVGTLRYMSPEQVRGLVLDESTDIYSLGATLYELLTLVPAFPGEDRQELQGRVALAEPAPIRRLNDAAPAELEIIVGKAMAKDPQERYASAGELADDLQRFLDDQPIRARPPTVRQRLRRWARRHRSLVASLTISAALLLTGFVLVSLLHAVRAQNLARERTAFAESKATSEKERTESLYRSLLGEAAAVRGARAPGYRRHVWAILRQALDLPLPEQDLEAIRTEVLACVGDPIGLDAVEAPRVARRGPGKIPAIFDRMLRYWKVPPAAPRVATPAGNLLAVSPWSTVIVFVRPDGRYAVRACPLGAVYRMQFTPDGELLVAGCEEGVVAWAVPSMTVSYLGIHAIFRIGNVRHVAVDPSGQMLATAGRQIELWSLTSSRPLAAFPNPTPAARVEFSADGKLLLAVEGDRVLRGWPVRETPEKRRLWGHHRGIPAVAFSADGRRLASVSKDFSLRLWDTATGALLHTCRWHGAGVEAVAFSPDGKLVATGDFAGFVRLFEVASGKEVARVGGVPLPGYPQDVPGQVWRLHFSARGDRLAAGGGKGVAVWTVRRSGKKVSLERLHEVRPPAPFAEVYDLAFHPDGNDLVFLARDGRLYSYNLRDGKRPRLLPPRSAVQLRALHFDARGDSLTFVAADGILTVWDWRKQTVARRTGLKSFQLARTNEGSRVATSRQDRRVIVCDLRTGKAVLTLPRETSDVWGLAWSPDGRRLAVALSDGGLAIWDLGQVRRRLGEFGLPTPSAAR